MNVVDRRFLRMVCLIGLCSLFSGCGLFSSADETSDDQPQPRAHHRRATPAPAPAPVTVTPDAYLLHLSLARLALAATPPDAAAAEAHFAALRAYAAQNPSTPYFQPAVVIAYKVKGRKELEHVMAPFALPQENASFPALARLMQALAGTNYTLNDIHAARVSITAPDGMSFGRSDPGQVQKELDGALQQLAQNSSTFSPLEETRLQMQLTRFFMRQHVRDAAYLCLDNAKLSLAKATEARSAGAGDAVNALSRELDALEEELQKSMPFSLGAF